MIFLLTAGDRPPPHFQERSNDAYVLAIEYFDPLHETGIQYSGPEHLYFRCALEAAIEIVPELEAVHILMTSQDPGAFELTAINSIALSANPSESQLLRQTVEMIGAGCFVDRTEERAGYDAEQVLRVKTIWRLTDLDDNVENHNRDWLTGLGFNAMILKELPQSGFARLILLSEPSDIHRKLEQLHADPSFSKIFGEHRFERFGTLRPPGGRTDIRLAHEPATRNMDDPVSLEFTCKWEDHPSMVAKSHTWTISCRPVERTSGRNWRFEATLVSEQGDDVPDNLWIELGCGGQLAY
jgi:hypothetical protein